MAIEEIARSHAATLKEWAAQYEGDAMPGAAEVAFRMKWMATAIEGMLNGRPAERFEPTPRSTEQDEPKGG